MAAETTTIEAARSRIQRLVDEIAGLSKADLATEDFFQKFLERAVQATDAKGGAVWLVGSRAQDNKSEFQLCAQVDFASSLFQGDEVQRTGLLKILTEVVHTKRPLLLAPDPLTSSGLTAAAAPSVNRTPFAFVHVPLFLKEQPVGVLQVWLMPYVTPKNYAEFVTFLSSLAAYVEQHLQSRRLGNLVLETQRLQQLLRFAHDIAGSLNPVEVARLTASYGRDLIGCERCSVLAFDGARWKVLAISGQEVVEKKSSMVKAMAAFVGAHCAAEAQVLSKKELLGGGESSDSVIAVPDAAGEDAGTAIEVVEQTDLDYFQLSHVVSAIVCPLLNGEKQIIGALFCESTFENFFEGPVKKTSELTASRRLAEWIADHSSRALVGARDYETLPLLGISRRLRSGQLLLTGRGRRQFWWKAGALVALFLLVALWPATVKVDGNCVLSPLRRASVVPEVPGRVEKVLVREGDVVREGDPIAQLDTRWLETQLQSAVQETLRFLAEVDRYRGGDRGSDDEGAAQVALLQSRISAENQKKIQAEIESATLRAPIDGVVMTKDLDKRSGEFLQAGSMVAEIADLRDWELLVEVNEKEIGRVEEGLRRLGSAVTNFILYSHSAYVFSARLERQQQISAVALPREQDTVFIVTYHNPEIPEQFAPHLRPGLTGRAKIELGRKPLIAIVSQNIARWFRMRFIG